MSQLPHPWKGGLATFRLLPGSGGDCSTCLSSSRRLAWLAVIPWSPRQQERASFNVQMFVLSHFSHVWCSVTPWTMATQAPLSMGFSRQEYWSGLPCLPPGDLPNPGIKPMSPALQVNSLLPSHLGNLLIYLVHISGVLANVTKLTLRDE